MLIDKDITKIKMRKAAGICTNVFIKMGKNGGVFMGALAGIKAVIKCSFDDIEEVNVENRNGGELR